MAIAEHDPDSARRERPHRLLGRHDGLKRFPDQSFRRDAERDRGPSSPGRPRGRGSPTPSTDAHRSRPVGLRWLAPGRADRHGSSDVRRLPAAHGRHNRLGPGRSRIARCNVLVPRPVAHRGVDDDPDTRGGFHRVDARDVRRASSPLPSLWIRQHDRRTPAERRSADGRLSRRGPWRPPS